MARLIMAPTSFVHVWATSRGGIKFKITGDDNGFEKKWKKLKREFNKSAKMLLEEQGSALCHEMARYSLPSRANTQLTANNALQVYERENQALAEVAFKTWESKGAMFWLLTPYSNVATHVVASSGFKFTSKTAENLFNIGKFDLLRDFLIKKGFKVPNSIPEPQFVSDRAELGTFINWKANYKKSRGKGNTHYVRDASSIIKIKYEKSLYNYASIVINGWLSAASDLGNKVPSGVKTITWPHGKGVGMGSASIKKRGGTSVTMTISNSYYNLNGIFNSSIQQTIWKNRTQIMDTKVEEMFQDLIKQYNS